MRRIHEILSEKLKRAQGLGESVKLRRSEANRYGYFVFITSDNPNPNEASKEAAKMANVLNLTKGKAGQWVKPYNAPKYFKDRQTGRFGWGYLITPNMDQEKINTLISHLKELVADYNKSENLEADLETQGMSENEIQRIQNIVQAVEAVEENTQNEAVKANLDRYLTELEDAVENDEVYDFLIKTYENVKNFQNQNTAWKYSFLNSLTITYGDPEAILAGPKQYWEERNYKIKDEFIGKGIMITKMGKKSDVWDKAKWFKNNPDKFEEFKRENGIPANVRYEDYVKKNAYKLAVYATKKGLVRQKAFSNFALVPTYTDTMVEPMPGKEVEPIVGDSTYVKEKGDLSPEDKQKVEAISAAVSIVGAKNKIPLGIEKTEDINLLNKMLNGISLQFVKEKLKYRLKGSAENRAAEEEILQAYGEVVAHIIKRHYGLPSDSSKYNIASLGGDKETIQKESNTIINLADKLITQIDAEIGAKQQALNEVRKMVREMLRKSR
jgi:hypothetical protein